MGRTLLGAALAASLLLAAAAEDHVVGGSAWRIPTSPGLYRAWADNRTVYVGDNLGEFTSSPASRSRSRAAPSFQVQRGLSSSTTE